MMGMSGRATLRAIIVAVSCVGTACNSAAAPDGGAPRDGTVADVRTDAPQPDGGRSGPPRIAIANFASRPDLQMVDVCAVPVGGGPTFRFGEVLGIAALTPGMVTNQVELPPGTYQFNAVDAASSDCATGIRGYMGVVEPGTDLTLAVAGGGTGEATALIGPIVRESSGRPGVSLLRTMVLAADSNAANAVDIAIDVGGTVEAFASQAFFWTNGFSSAADSNGYQAVPPAVGVQLIVRYRDAVDEIGRSASFNLSASHSYTAYLYPYAFRGAAEFRVVVCDETEPGTGALADCR